MSTIKKNWSGILLCLVIAVPAWYLGKLFPVVGGPVLAILIGLLVAIIPRKPSLQSGIQFTSKKVLQYAIILLGFDMNLFHILEVGRQSLAIIIVTISTALIVAYLISRLLKIPSKTAILIGVGSSICGGSAIAATAPVIDADDEDVAKSISTIFLFNVLAAFLFPAAGMALGMSDQGFGMWAGTAVNDTSSVVAAATTWSSAAGNDTALTLATIVKLTRTLAIIPITFVLALYRSRKEKQNAKGNFKLAKIFPWFILFFLMAAVVSTITNMPAAVASAFDQDWDLVVFDVGGDQAGALSLARYHQDFAALPEGSLEVYDIVNVFRPAAETPEKILKFKGELEDFARATVTGFVNNSNLLNWASADDLRQGYDILRATSDMSGIPVVHTTGRKKFLDEFLSDGRDEKYIGTPLALETYMYRSPDNFTHGKI